MSIAGVTTVKNESDIISFCLNQHFDQGINDIYINDNGSTDGTYEILQQMSEMDSRIHVFNDTSGFHQADIVNNLYSIACENGAEWVVPFDADELWVSKNTLAKDLCDVNTFSVMVNTINFIQSREYDLINPYLTATWRIKNSYNVDLDKIFSGSLSMSEVNSAQKFIVRADKNTTIGAGAHNYDGPDQIYTYGENFSILHVPIRSFGALFQKAMQGKALIEAGYPSGHGFHVQRYNDLYNRGMLESEWLANSVQDENINKLNGEQAPVFYDDTISKIYKKYLEGIK